MISAVDLLPTFCAVAGADLPGGYQPDGVNQLEVMQGSKDGGLRSKPLFWKYGARKKSKTHWVSFAVVHNQWKFVTNSDGTRQELYDIVADPYEKTDLKESKKEEIIRLLSLLEEWKKSLPAAPSGEVFSSLRKQKQ
jgi:N-acetylgalactosamine-6-sulfatase